MHIDTYRGGIKPTGKGCAKKDDKKTGQQEEHNKTKGRSSRSRRRSAARQRKSAAKLLKDPRAAQGGAEDQDVAGAQGARITMADLRASGNELGTKSPANAHDSIAAADVQDGEKGTADALEAPVQGDGDAPDVEVEHVEVRGACRLVATHALAALGRGLKPMVRPGGRVGPSIVVLDDHLLQPKLLAHLLDFRQELLFHDLLVALSVECGLLVDQPRALCSIF